MSHRREILLTHLMIAFTAIAAALAYAEIGMIGVELFRARDFAGVAEQGVFVALFSVFVYSYAIYLITRIGQLRRRYSHVPLPDEALDTLFNGECPSVAVLVPAYKEESAIVRRTLLSAALQQYPRRHVVLLIDDPYHPQDRADAANLAAMRALPSEVQGLIDPILRRCEQAHRGFVDRCLRGRMDPHWEATRLGELCDEIATWFDGEIGSYPIHDHGDVLFVEWFLTKCRDGHRARADTLRRCAAARTFDCAAARREYRRLAALFRVKVTSFERKRYENLSHEVNKAMNLNSYIGLMGGSYREVAQGDGRDQLLQAAPRGTGAIDIPTADYLLTVDADSVLLPNYAATLACHLSQGENARVAVAQTPYSAFPGAPGTLERTAGATTDIQYLIHQGFTAYNATFWVGANALLRKSALDDICTEHEERGYCVRKYIQDRTVIEDTESSIDLTERGWTLFNYPERLAYSATPSDFGSLLIQRRRWANGGLIILPKALRYLRRGPIDSKRVAEATCRIHYLTSIAIVNVALLLILSGWFERNAHIIWLLVASLPYMFLYARDLVACGYRATDFLRVYALNVLLVPVHIGGTVKSLHQALTGKRTPFARTPKVIGRTAAPGLYVFAEFVLLISAAVMVGVNAAAGAWVSAGFAAGYVAFCGYAIVRLMGIRASFADLRLWLRRGKPASIPARAEARFPIDPPAPIALFGATKADRPVEFGARPARRAIRAGDARSTGFADAPLTIPSRGAPPQFDRAVGTDSGD